MAPMRNMTVNKATKPTGDSTGGTKIVNKPSLHNDSSLLQFTSAENVMKMQPIHKT